MLGIRRSGSVRTTVSPIGFDISPRALRAAQLDRTGDRWTVARVTSWHRRDTEQGTSMSGGFAARIKRSMQQSGYRGRSVVAGLSIPEVEMHALEIADRVDASPNAKFDETVRRELDRVMSCSSGSVATSFWRLPKSKEARTTAVGVAASSASVESAFVMSKGLGLECECVDSTSCALSRLGSVLRRGMEGTQQSVWSVLDVGYRVLRLTVVVGETPVIVRTLGGGGQGWTQAVAESLGLSLEAAEIHKLDHGISVGSINGSSTKSSAPSAGIASMILSILRSDLDGVATEIERSYEYVMRCYPDHSAAGVLLVGGGADLKGLDGYLAGKLGVEVQRLDDVLENTRNPNLTAPSIRESLSPYACAIGLAIEPETAR